MTPTRSQISELRQLLNGIKSPVTFKKYFIQILNSDIKLSEEMLLLLLEPCWGHMLFNGAHNIDVIDGPEVNHKINCNTCINLLVMNKKIL